VSGKPIQTEDPENMGRL